MSLPAAFTEQAPGPRGFGKCCTLVQITKLVVHMRYYLVNTYQNHAYPVRLFDEGK